LVRELHVGSTGSTLWVFVTALITPEEARDARRIDGHRISAKPHTAAELLRIVEESRPCCAEA